MLRVSTSFFAVALLLFAPASHCLATGYSGPSDYLDAGAGNVDASPEFYWELEVKRLAKDFHPAEKRLPASATDEEAQGKMKQAADESDRAAAKRDGRDPDNQDSEFSQYEAGADSYRSGVARRDDLETQIRQAADLPGQNPPVSKADEEKARAEAAKDLQAAREAWERLMKLPAADRHYRSVWAAYMLGKVALRQEDPAAAVQWFIRTRELARQGFSDPLALAADSYGWEARAEWKAGHPERAAPLYLAQLALGDESAVISLKALIPDRDPVDGMLNYGPELDEKQKWSEQQARVEEKKTLLALELAARDPLLRRLVTAHILATTKYALQEGRWLGGTPLLKEVTLAAYWEYPKDPARRCARWLAIVDKAKPGPVEDAEYLGWVAYSDGAYDQARRWLALAKNKEAPAACWLRAKLALRAGQLADAAANMRKAWQTARDSALYTGWKSPEASDENSVSSDYEESYDAWTFPQSASGDLGALSLQRGDFIEAMDTFLKGNLWEDGAFVAENVLTAAELITYVDQQPPPAPAPVVSGSNADGRDIYDAHSLRYLLGRRLVREDRYDEAARYLSPPFDKVLQKYVQALKAGADEKTAKVDRARAFFTAAWIARHHGMELMGTEVAPDSFETGGAFENPDVARQRLTGRYKPEDNKPDSPIPTELKPSKAEKRRLAANQVKPDLRYHYRVIAAALAMKAAALLPSDTEELADVVNTAGGWVKDIDNKVADRYYQVLDSRCAKTKLGAAAIAKRWFISDSGPWSNAQEVAFQEMDKQVGIPTPEPQ